jgi:hypothetical protein
VGPGYSTRNWQAHIFLGIGRKVYDMRVHDELYYPPILFFPDDRSAPQKLSQTFPGHFFYNATPTPAAQTNAHPFSIWKQPPV